MADTLKELGMKVFSDTEIQNGTRFDITTGSNEAFVIKDVELTQTSNGDAVAGTVTAGTTTNFGNGIHSDLGSFGANVTNLSGSAILDVSSTLSIRPIAKTITYKYIRIFAEDSSGSTSATGPINLITIPTVNGNSEPQTKTVLTASNPGSGTGSYSSNVSGNFSIMHTNANGIELFMRFVSGSSSGNSVYIVGADNNTSYATVSSSYSRIMWDGNRYLFWLNSGYIYFFDLDDSNITNPTAHGNTAHGRMTLGASVNSPTVSYNTTTYDVREGDLQVSPSDGKTYFYQFAGSQGYGLFAQLPDTIADNVVVPKFFKTSNGGNYTSLTPSGMGHNNNVYYNEYGLKNQTNFGTQYSWCQLFYKEDAVYGDRWFITHKANADEIVFFTFLDADMKSFTTNNSILGTNDSSGGNHANYGLTSISYQDLSNPALGWNSSNFENNSWGAVLKFSSSYAQANISGLQDGTWNHYFFDGEIVYIASVTSSTFGVFRLDIKGTAGEQVVDTADHVAYRGNYFVAFPTPSQSEINARTYTKKPGLKVRITGIREDRS